MSQTIAPVQCNCGAVNRLTSSNATIAHFKTHPEYDHLRSWCQSCGAQIRLWSQDDIATAVALHWEVLTAIAPDPELMSAYRRLHPPRYRLTPRHEHDLAKFRDDLEQLIPEDVVALMEGGERHRPSTRPAVWPCNCGSPTCAPITETAVGTPLEAT